MRPATRISFLLAMGLEQPRINLWIKAICHAEKVQDHPAVCIRRAVARCLSRGAEEYLLEYYASLVFNYKPPLWRRYEIRNLLIIEFVGLSVLSGFYIAGQSRRYPVEFEKHSRASQEF